MNETRIAAFVEYVLRPLSEDWRIIIEQLKQLNVGITQDTVNRICFALGMWHLAGELIRAFCYIFITWIICQTVVKII